jgi:hypothetical protein
MLIASAIIHSSPSKLKSSLPQLLPPASEQREDKELSPIKETSIFLSPLRGPESQPESRDHEQFKLIVKSPVRKKVCAQDSIAKSPGRNANLRSSRSATELNRSVEPCLSHSIEDLRLIASARVSKAQEKQRLKKQKEESESKRGRDVAEKQLRRARYRAEIYAVNKFLKERENALFETFKREQRHSITESDSEVDSDGDDSFD